MGDIMMEMDFYAAQRERRRAGQCRRRDFIMEELDKPVSMLNDNDPRWDDMWTTTSSDDE
jgi:hypothetical protein